MDSVRDGQGNVDDGRFPAVSYTHLDVYKRQALRPGRALENSGKSFFLDRRARCAEDRPDGNAGNGQGREAVSYTHLDVYKRQAYRRWLFLY